MTKSAEYLLEQALALDGADRAELVERLAVTLEPSTEPEYIAAWEAEIQSRIAQIDSGHGNLIPAVEAMRMIERGIDPDVEAR